MNPIASWWRSLLCTLINPLLKQKSKEGSSLDHYNFLLSGKSKEQEGIRELQQNKLNAEEKINKITAHYQNLYMQNLERNRKLDEVYQESVRAKKEREKESSARKRLKSCL